MTHDHNSILDNLEPQFEPLLNQSAQAIYVWLDDAHMMCNDHLATLFGYENADEMVQAGPFLDTFVAEADQARFSANYDKCIAHMGFPLTFQFQAVKKDGSHFKAETVMIPLPFSDHILAYHFVRQVD